jgi:uncharacterized protein (DUF58 family)
MKPFALIKSKYRKIVFLEKHPEPGELILKQRRVFTLPSKAGLLFGLMLFVLFLTSTNYNLNLGFVMTYLLAGVGLTNTLFTFRNLAYLRLNAGHAAAVFAGEQATFPIQIKNSQQLDRYAIQIGFLGKNHVFQMFDLAPHDSKTIHLRLATQSRGVLPIPRICLQTTFPLGLLRAWSTWLPVANVLVYPCPEAHPPPLPFSGDSSREGTRIHGDEDYSGVKSYQVGDPLKHLSWKHIARIDIDAGGSLISKQFSGGSAGELILDFASIPNSVDLETRLSRMASWILEADSKGLAYGFCLGNLTFTPACTEPHRNACLTALALFQTDAAQSSQDEGNGNA